MTNPLVPVVLTVGGLAAAIGIANTIEVRNRRRREARHMKTLYHFDGRRGEWRPAPPQDQR